MSNTNPIDRKKLPGRFGGLTRRQSDSVRAHIQAEAIVQRLCHFVLGTKDENGQIVEMSQPQVTAAYKLLDKCVPTLQAIQIQEVAPGRPIEQVRTDIIKIIAADPSLLTGIAQQNPELAANIQLQLGQAIHEQTAKDMAIEGQSNDTGIDTDYRSAS